MKKWITAAAFALVVGTVSFEAGTLRAQNVPSEANAHPRLATAVAALVDARAYLQSAPHDFGGHKTSAVAAIDAALVELRAALAFRANVDHAHRMH